jgi:hypothetical protein
MQMALGCRVICPCPCKYITARFLPSTYSLLCVRVRVRVRITDVVLELDFRRQFRTLKG